MKPKTSNNDRTPYVVPVYILQGMAQYMVNLQYVLHRIAPDMADGPLDILGLAECIINEYNPDQPPLTLIHLPSFTDENTQE